MGSALVFQFQGSQEPRCLWTERSIVQKLQRHLLMGRKSTRIILSPVRNAFVFGLIIASVTKIECLYEIYILWIRQHAIKLLLVTVLSGFGRDSRRWEVLIPLRGSWGMHPLRETYP